MKNRALALSILLLPSLGQAGLHESMKPMEFLLGHCWQGILPDGKRDIQCYASLYDGAFISNTQMVIGPPAPLYRGMTVFYREEAGGALKYHYYTSLGELSVGDLALEGSEFHLTERTVNAAGKATVYASVLRREGEFSYTNTIREKVGDGWKEHWTVRYLREDAPEAVKEVATLKVKEGTWGLFWNTNRDGKWRIYAQDPRGNQVSVTKHAKDDWLWSTRDGMLYTLTKDLPEGTRGWAGRTVDGSGELVVPIGSESLGDGFVDCMPGGQKCAAEVHIEGKKRIAWFDAAGKRIGLMGDARFEDADPQFSSDGRRMLFRSTRGGSWEIYIANADGTNARMLTSDPRNDGLDRGQYGGEGPARLSPDGNRIVWMRKFPGEGNDIWTMNSDGSDARNLTAGNTTVGDGYPSFSPDGRLIAFDSNRTGDIEIFIMDADGTNPRRITYTPGSDLAPLWVRLPQESAK